LSWLSSKGFERLAWVLELDRKACSRPASKRFQELEWALEVKLEGIPEAALERMQECRKASGAGSRRQSRGWPRRGSRAWNGRWSWISKAISRLASKRFASLERAMELDLEGNLEAGFEDLRKVEAGSEAGSGRHS
jgi:hypothetical protein